MLSAGQRRRLALARLVVAPRPLWLLDEPTTGLDADGRKTLIALATAHLAGGGLLVVATHAPLQFPRTQEIRLGQRGGQ
jgi:heme exporter protein A